MTALATLGMATAVILPSAAVAIVLVRLLDGGARWSARLLATSLSLGGLGIASLPVFFWVTLGGRLTRPFMAVDALTFASLAVVAAWLGRRVRPLAAGGSGEPGATGTAIWFGLAALVVVAAAALWGSAIEAGRLPHGKWDAWATWNLRARFLFRATDWHAVMHADPPLSHIDYPLQLPASVGRLWVYAGVETTRAPRLLAFLFTFGAAALCGSALLVLRGATVALTASLLVLANSDFLLHGQSQYADVPVGYYLLAALVLTAWHDQMARPGSRPWTLLLAGLAAGLSAWTKNEGLLFVLVLLGVRAGLALRHGAWNRLRLEIAWLGTGLALPLASVALYKSGTPHGSWLLDQRTGGLLERLLDPARFRFVLGEFGRHLFDYGSGAVLAAAAVAFVLTRAETERRSGPLWPLGVVGLVLAGYFLAFLASPLDLRWLFDETASRLLSQVWPTSVFALFMAAAPITAPPPAPAAPGSPPAAGRTPA